MIRKVFLFVIFLQAYVNADIYMHNPRGSNNRLNENGRERANGNRLFDSQNNKRGGYNVGQNTQNNNAANQRPMHYYVGSTLPIEWTSQHSCGTDDGAGKERNHNSHCELIIQYMCAPQLRDGTSTNTIQENNPNDQSKGMHEDGPYYQACKNRARNKNLFTADQELKGNAAIYTRQNPGGTRRGLECPEERDYFPYWGPSPWKDIAVLTNDISRCATIYKKANPNIDCKKAPSSRDNHNGNGPGGFPNYYNWTIPNDVNGKCALRIRYNISTSEIAWGLNATDNAPQQNNNNNNNNYNPSRVNAGAGQDMKPIMSFFRGYMLTGNPTVAAFDDAPRLGLELAVNTAQYGRTFQDRSHKFEIRARPTNIPANAPIYNLNVRGKRGNIVQTYPAVEYDFVPNRLEIPQNDYVHIQWTGSDRNPQNNDGQGRAGTDRSNMVVLKPQSFNEGTPGRAVPVTLKNGQFGANIPECLCNSTFLGLSYEQRDSLVVGVPPSSNDELDNTDPYFNLPPQKVSTVPGTTYHYMCTRNNNFSNRGQKGRITILPPTPNGRKRSAELVDEIKETIMDIKDAFGMVAP